MKQTQLKKTILIVSVVTFVLTFSAFASIGSIKEYLNLRDEVAAKKIQLNNSQNYQRYIEGELKRWDDVSFRQAQVRSNLGYVLPGETAIHVINPDAIKDDDLSKFVGSANLAENPIQKELDKAAMPWYLRITESISK